MTNEPDMNKVLDEIFVDKKDERPRIGRDRAEAALRRLFSLDEDVDLTTCSLRWCVGVLTERRAGEPKRDSDPPAGTPLVPRAGEMVQVFAPLIAELGPMGITVEKALSIATVDEACDYIANLEDRSGPRTA
jgi:hypothetical protein